MEQRKHGKAAAKMSSVAEKILTKANYVKDTRHHKNCFPFVQDWLERFLEKDASRQENGLLKLCDQDSPELPPHPLTPPASLSPPLNQLWAPPHPLIREVHQPPHQPLYQLPGQIGLSDPTSSDKDK